MAYRLNYSDYSTTTGPPDPAAWVGPPGPMGPPGPQGVPGPMPPGGPFLPLTGGTVSGPTAFNAGLNFSGGSYVPGSITSSSTWGGMIRPNTGGGYADFGIVTADGNTQALVVSGSGVTSVTTLGTVGSQTISGSALPVRWMSVGQNIAGTTSAAGYYDYATIGSASDALTAPNAHLLYLDVIGQVAAGWDGGRLGVNATLKDTAATPHGTNHGLIAFNGMIQNNYNQGGTATGFGTVLGTGEGGGFGAVIGVGFTGGATYMAGQTGVEIDFYALAGSSYITGVGLQIVHNGAHAVAGTSLDCAMRISDQVGVVAGWKDALHLVGSYDAQWPAASTAYLFQARSGQNNSSKPAVAAGGIDLLEAQFTGSGQNGGGFAFRTAGPVGVAATAIDSTGGVRIGTGYINATAAGLTIDTPLWVFSAIASIVSGGAGFTSGDLVNDGLGNIFSVTAAAGVVTALTLKYRAEARLATPSGTITCYALTVTGSRFGTGLQITETWVRAGALSIQPSAGATTIGGPLNTVGSANFNGITFTDVYASAANDLSKHILLHTGGVGISATNGRLNLNTAAAIYSVVNGTDICSVWSDGLHMTNGIGFFGSSIPASRPTVTGAKGSNAALASLLTALVAYGLVTDSTSA